jgi:hypothetical protein
MKLWIDDLREPPDATWTWVKSSADALLCIKHFASDISEISFDHDLGGSDTSMPVAREIEERAFRGRGDPVVWHVHSANPAGRKNLKMAMQSAERFWAKERAAR